MTSVALTGLRFVWFRIPRALPWAVILLPLWGENQFIHNLEAQARNRKRQRFYFPRLRFGLVLKLPLALRMTRMKKETCRGRALFLYPRPSAPFLATEQGRGQKPYLIQWLYHLLSNFLLKNKLFRVTALSEKTG